jgi:hypothetical protein
MFELKGNIEFDPINVSKKHSKQSAWKKTCLVKFDCEMHLYYAWFIERRFGLKLNQPLRGTHVTVINDIVDDEIYRQSREVFNGKEITLQLDPTNIRSNSTHWWLKVYSDDARNIRSAMGLTPDPYFGLHMTIGLANERNLLQSQYILSLIKKGLVEGD